MLSLPQEYTTLKIKLMILRRRLDLRLELECLSEVSWVILNIYINLYTYKYIE